MTMSKIVEKAKRLSIALGWYSPFFAIPAAKVRFREDAVGFKVNTMGVTADGIIYLHTPFCKKLSDAQFKWVIAHELMHLLMRHAARQGNRTVMVIPVGPDGKPYPPTLPDGKPNPDAKPISVWNIAGDMAINHALVTSGLKSYSKGAIFPESGWETWHAERIYDQIVQNLQDKPSVSMSGDGLTPGAGCGVMPPEGSEDGEEPKSETQLDQEWSKIAAQAQAMARKAGDAAGAALATICDIPPARVNWAAVVRRGMASALAVHGRDSQTWTRRGRRSRARGAQFPGWHATAARAAVVIDTSGSVSDEELSQFVAETMKISQASGVSVYLVTHDHGVQWEGWLSPKCHPAEIKKTLRGRGGTCAEDAYRKVAAAGRFDVMIHLTDGGLVWPPWPSSARQKVVALVGYDGASVPEGARVIEIGSC